MNHLKLQLAVGSLSVAWNAQGLLGQIEWSFSQPESASAQDAPLLPARPSVEIISSGSGIPSTILHLVERVRSYFERSEPIGEVPGEWLDRSEWSEYQKVVYGVILEIPHGETQSYSWVAQKVGQRMRKSPAPRAVGQALRKNPLPILIPCHRVVATTDLGGFMGTTDPMQPELRFKRWLIELESHYRAPSFAFAAPVNGLEFFEGMPAATGAGENAT